jgi:hypothetical protein
MNFSAWDLPVTLAVLLQITKASDLILRKRQQDWVNRVCDSIALFLDEIKPLTWFRMVRLHGVRKVLLWSAMILFVLIATLMMCATLALNGSRRADESSIYGDLALGFISLIVNLKALSEEGPFIMNNIFSEDRFCPFLKVWGAFLWQKYRVLIPTALLVNFAGFCLVGSLGYWVALVILAVPLIAFAMFQSLAFLGFLSGLIVIFAELVLGLLAILVGGFRAIAWRVVEYNKGAWAALTLIATVGLGIVDIYMRATHKT